MQQEEGRARAQEGKVQHQDYEQQTKRAQDRKHRRVCPRE